MRQNVVVDPEALVVARQLRAEGINWSQISRITGYSVELLRRRIDPAFMDRRNRGIRAWRDGETSKSPTPAEALRLLKTIPPDTRSPCARLMGDPLPGRSALDKKTEARAHA